MKIHIVYLVYIRYVYNHKFTYRFVYLSFYKINCMN
jgi:hypothetical protein